VDHLGIWKVPHHMVEEAHPKDEEMSTGAEDSEMNLEAVIEIKKRNG